MPYTFSHCLYKCFSYILYSSFFGFPQSNELIQIKYALYLILAKLLNMLLSITKP